MTDQEQLLLELVNRARDDPAAEAALWGIDLNESLEPDEISTESKQPLAPHQSLITAAGRHADDMLVREFFEHENPDGVGPSERARAAGYPVGAGENLAWFGNPGFLDRDDQVTRRHEALFLSSPHRTNMMTPGYRELGNGVRYGEFARVNSIMVAQSFGNRGGDYFITGVAFTDTVIRDDFYSIGESLDSVQITATRNRDGETYLTTTGSSGGYALQVPRGVYLVTAEGPKIPGTMVVESVVVLARNSKVDFNTRSPGLGSITGIAFGDDDRDGVRDAAEAVLSNREVFLDVDGNAKLGAGEVVATTASDGTYKFSNLRAATYTIVARLPPGWTSTEPAEGQHEVELASGQRRLDVDFGSVVDNYAPVAQPDSYSTESGRAVAMDVFANDSDRDGVIVSERTRIHAPPRNGKVVLNTRTEMLVYTPDPGFDGTDQFEYAIEDDGGIQSDPVAVTVTVTPLVGLAWQNQSEPLDVNADGFVSPIDALLVLNVINRNGAGPLSFPSEGESPPPYLDVNGDTFVSPLDALLVLNEVNRIAAERRSGSSAEGEPLTVRPVGASFPAAPSLIASAVDAFFERRLPGAQPA